MKLSPLHFHLSMTTQKFEVKKDSIQNRLFAHRRRLFPSETHEKRLEYDNFGLFLRPLIIALNKKSSLYF